MQVQSLEIISVNIWQILISLANLLIIFLVAKKFLFQPVQKVVAQRKAQVDTLYADADNAKAAAEGMRTQYEAKLATARETADTLVRDAKDAAQRRSDAMLAEATQQAAHIKQKAEGEIEQQKKQMLSEVRGEISDLAVSIASKVLHREINAEDQKQLVDDFIRNVGEQD